ncbi:hypothetical protein Tco_1012015, partial [Tanacetum coccineum]
SMAKGKGKKKNDKKGKGKVEHLAPKAGIVKQKFQRTCCNCDQPGHRAANYKMLKAVDNGEKLYMGNSVTADIKVEKDVILKITVVRSDRGGEYVSSFVDLCAKHGIRHEFTA